jgi:hypothetical protein
VVTRSFADLVDEAAKADVTGWDFSWLDGRASEQRPSWGCAAMMAKRMAAAGAALDVQTGGGEVLASVPKRPPLTIATEAWPPNVAKATALLHPLGVAVVAHDDETALPFAAGAVIYFLRKVIWIVPGFTVGSYLARLRDLHEQIQETGPFVATTTRFLIEAERSQG